MKKIAILQSAAIGVLMFSYQASADQVIADDAIIQSSLCVGFDCVNGESFGFDTIRLKENNLRIKFQDTSSGSFPTTDWQITANDSSSGGQNKFSIDDVDAGRTPFTIEAGARSHSLYVDDAGRVGFGTSTPVVELHVRDGDSPTLRLEQDGSSGFTAQTWDLAGNEANFFIRDVTNGSKLPFRIRPGAPTSAIDIAADGDVGIGTSSPVSALHISRSDGTAQLRVEEASTTSAARTMLALQNNGEAKFVIKNTNFEPWVLKHSTGNDFQILQSGGSGSFVFENNGDLTISGTLITGGPTCDQGNGGCDYVFSPEYSLDSIEDHALKMWKNSYLPAVGPTASNVPINLTEKTGAILNELEKAHIYIEQLNTRITKKDELISDLLERVSALEKISRN